MTTKQANALKVELPAVARLPGGGALALSAQALLQQGRTPNRAEAAITDQLRTDLAMQVGVAVKMEHAEQLAQTITLRTVQRFDEFLTFERTIRDQKRHADDQADLEVFCHAVRQSQANTLLAIRQAGLNRIETIVLNPLDPPAEVKEEVIIEQKPGLLGRLFGGQQVTRVKR